MQTPEALLAAIEGYLDEDSVSSVSRGTEQPGLQSAH